MSSSTALPIRGASPAAIGFATAGISGSKAATLNAQIQAISTAGNMNELIDTIPSRYRPLLAPILREMQDIHGKFCNAQKNLASLRAHQTNGTWPSFLAGLSDPFASIQMSKESRSPLSLSLTDAQTWFRVMKEEALVKVIALKQAEVECLENLYSPPAIRDRCSKELDNDWANLKKALGKFTAEDDSGQGIAIPGFFKTEFSSAKELIPSWVAKSWDFTRIKSTKISKELERKAELAKAATDAMDTSPDGETLTETVQKAVAAALRQQNKPAAQKRGKDKGKGKNPAKKDPSLAFKPNKPSGIKAKASQKNADGKRKRDTSGKGSGPSKKKEKKEKKT